jgi:ferredoxin
VEEEEFIQEAMDDCPVDAIRAVEALQPQADL